METWPRLDNEDCGFSSDDNRDNSDNDYGLIIITHIITKITTVVAVIIITTTFAIISKIAVVIIFEKIANVVTAILIAMSTAVMMMIMKTCQREPSGTVSEMRVCIFKQQLKRLLVLSY